MGLRTDIRRRRFVAAMRREVRPERFAAFGAGSMLHPPVSVGRPEAVSIGERVFMLSHAQFALGPEARVSIGSGTYMGRDFTIIAAAGVHLGEDVMGSDRVFLCDTGPRPTRHGVPVASQDLAEGQPIHVGEGVFLGTGAMVLAGVTIGARSFIGAGAVVTHSVPANCLAVGNPARVVRYYDPDRAVWVDGQPS